MRKQTLMDKCVEALKRNDIVKPTIILLALFVLQQLSGAYVIIFYAVSLFQKVGGRFEDYEYINEYGALLLLGLIRFIMSILASGWVLHVGNEVNYVTFFSPHPPSSYPNPPLQVFEELWPPISDDVVQRRNGLLYTGRCLVHGL